jgi:hypothetical protein
MVDLAQHPGPGVGHVDTGAGERADHFGGRVRVQPVHAERRVDLGGQLGQPARRPDRLRRAEQLAQQLVVHVGPPRQPRVPHFGTDQRTRRFGRDQQAEPPRTLGTADPPELPRVHLLGGLEHVEAGGGPRSPECLEECALGEARRFGHPRRRIGRHRQPVQPRPRRRQRSGRAPPARVPHQQRLGQLEIMAARHPHPGP